MSSRRDAPSLSLRRRSWPTVVVLRLLLLLERDALVLRYNSLNWS
jgi:hypothetical protein